MPSASDDNSARAYDHKLDRRTLLVHLLNIVHDVFTAKDWRREQQKGHREKQEKEQMENQEKGHIEKQEKGQMEKQEKGQKEK